MKSHTKQLTVILMVMLLSITQAFSAILRVNNNTGVTGTGVYATLAAAYGASAPGDTLLVEGSNTVYADLAIAQKIIIIGTGYLLSNNANTQANLLTTKLSNLTYNTGSDGSVVMGCTVNSITVNDNNITIARNYISNTTLTSASITLNGNTTNTIIKQNMIYGLITNTANKTPSVVISNNLLGRVLFTSSITDALIINNTFYWPYAYYSSYSPAVDVNKSTFSNNIVWSNSYGTMVFDESQGNTITYNYYNQGDPGTYNGANNLFGESTNPFTVASPDAVIDNNFMITAGSAAETAAQDGGQCGMFGGTDPYVLSGMPPIPHIYKLESDPAGNNTNPLNVKISVKAQN